MHQTRSRLGSVAIGGCAIAWFVGCVDNAKPIPGASAIGGASARPTGDAQSDVNQGGRGEMTGDGQGASDQGVPGIGQAGSSGGDNQPRFALHVVDVSGGLGIFVEGSDFTLVFDAGSDDDSTTDSRPNRFVDYLKAVRPDLERIDHVILSHPHQDHVDLLADVISRYEIGAIWDSGASSNLCAYENFMVAVENELSTAPATYHSAANGEGMHEIPLSQPCIDFASVVTANPNRRASVTLMHGTQIAPGLSVDLGAEAKMTFLYANGVTDKDNPNFNSLVVRLDIGGKRLLLPGDANDQPSSSGAPSPEAQLLKLPSGELESDVLVAGFHGFSGAATGFIAAVAPSIAIIPVYAPYPPTPDVLQALGQSASIFRTDADDSTCGSDPNKIGAKNDGKLGGCSNVKVTLEQGAVTARYLRSVD